MDANNKLAFELQNAIGQLGRSKALKHQHSRLKGAEMHALILIGDLKNGRPVTVSEIAKKIGVTLAAVTHQVNALEQQGLLKRLSDANDRRVVLVGLTKKGTAQTSKLKAGFSKKIQSLVEFLGEKDAKDLVRLVKKMSEYKALND